MRNRTRLLPLKKVEKVLIVPISHYEPAIVGFKQLVKEFEKRNVKADIVHHLNFEACEKVEKEYDLIFYALYTRPHQPLGGLSFHGKQFENIWGTLTCGQEKSIVVSFGSPYYMLEFFERADTYINAYSRFDCCQTALIEAIFGEIPFYGKSPVILTY